MAWASLSILGYLLRRSRSATPPPRRSPSVAPDDAAAAAREASVAESVEEGELPVDEADATAIAAAAAAAASAPAAPASSLLAQSSPARSAPVRGHPGRQASPIPHPLDCCSHVYDSSAGLILCAMRSNNRHAYSHVRHAYSTQPMPAMRSRCKHAWLICFLQAEYRHVLVGCLILQMPLLLNCEF